MSRNGELYPPIDPYRSGRLAADAIHSLYWEECGNPNGVPVLFLHGGPGAGCSPEHRRFFDPHYYRIVLFDQRGAGRSTPHAEVTNNTTAHLVGDIETLRAKLDIQRWHVFGGSWGSTLALAYAQAHPQPCLSLTLRGIFLLQKSEVDWFTRGIRLFSPHAWDAFNRFLPESLREDICEGYWIMLNDPDPQVRMAAANAWAGYEARNVMLRSNAPVAPVAPARADGNSAASRSAVGLARLEVHYMRSQRFEPDDALLRGVRGIRHIPCAIVQGKYDLLCPPITAAALHEAWPESTLHIIEDAGHSAFEPGIRAALVQIMDSRINRPVANT
jgi:proline iminopeptidase